MAKGEQDDRERAGQARIYRRHGANRSCEAPAGGFGRFASRPDRVAAQSADGAGPAAVAANFEPAEVPWREYGVGHNQRHQSAKPGDHRAPENDGAVHLVQPVEHRGARRRDHRNHFEIGDLITE